jgi:DNA-binding MurR/RpiR family transcriptional regulator
LEENLIACMDKHAAEFSKGQRRIAAYIEEHYDKVAMMTASRLGATVGVSESTVVRFATELGYSGYAELQRAMQEMIRSRLNSVQRFEITAVNVPYRELLSAAINQDIDMLRSTLEETSEDDFYAERGCFACPEDRMPYQSPGISLSSTPGRAKRFPARRSPSCARGSAITG